MNTLLKTLFISKRNETEIQCLLCMIQKAPEKHSNTFMVLHVFKHHSMNVNGY